MRNLVLGIVFLLTLLAPVQAELAGLLAWQQRGDAGAYVSSGFHDWRTVSKYRSRPGLHAGYDIAMLAGSPVRAAWPGTVVDITPWYGAEYGVTVRSSHGYETTYGHISPLVEVGESVSEGSVLGSVVVDHVDVKMRDSSGAFVDFQELELNLPQLEQTQPAFLVTTALPELKAQMKNLRLELEQKQQAYEYGLLPRKEVEQLQEQVAELAKVVGASPIPEKTELAKVKKVRRKTDILIRRATKSEKVEQASSEIDSSKQVE